MYLVTNGSFQKQVTVPSSKTIYCVYYFLYHGEAFFKITFVCGNYKNLNPAFLEILRKKLLCYEILFCTF